VWDLGENGEFHRTLPGVADSQVEAAFRELSQPRFAAALASFREAMKAYDDRPQRGRDTCKNIFDALESVSKETFIMPAATFGNVLTEVRKRASETISALQKLYDMANNHFRHGMTTPFTLKSAEVDFVLVSCIAGHSSFCAPMIKEIILLPPSVRSSHRRPAPAIVASMTNREFTNLLKEGVMKWNQWRLENPDVVPDLRKADLRETDLRVADVREAKFRGADLGGADLRRGDLEATRTSAARTSGELTSAGQT
jgi:hypothetical protein